MRWTVDDDATVECYVLVGGMWQYSKADIRPGLRRIGQLDFPTP